MKHLLLADRHNTIKKIPSINVCSEFIQGKIVLGITETNIFDFVEYCKLDTSSVCLSLSLSLVFCLLTCHKHSLHLFLSSMYLLSSELGSFYSCYFIIFPCASNARRPVHVFVHHSFLFSLQHAQSLNTKLDVTCVSFFLFATAQSSRNKERRTTPAQSDSDAM